MELKIESHSELSQNIFIVDNYDILAPTSSLKSNNVKGNSGRSVYV